MQPEPPASGGSTARSSWAGRLPGASGWYDPRTSELNISGDADVIRRLVTPADDDAGAVVELRSEDLAFAHECAHWFTDLGTAYGYTSKVIENDYVSWVARFVGAVHERFPNETIRLPLRAFYEGDELWGHLINALTTAVSQHRLIETGDAPTELVTEVASSFSHFWLPRQRDFWRQFATSVGGTQSRSSAHALGARELCEGIAHAAEEMAIAACQLAGRPLAPDVMAFSTSTHFGVYAAALSQFETALGLPELPEMEPLPRLECLFVFIVLCDVCLNAPFRPGHVTEWLRPVEASDYVPGRRFQRALDVMDGWAWRGEPHWTDYDRVALRVCEPLGWPKPRAIWTDRRNFNHRDGMPVIQQLVKRAYRLRARWPHAPLVPFFRGWRFGDDWATPLWTGLPPLYVSVNDNLPHSFHHYIRPIYFGRQRSDASEVALLHVVAAESIRWADWLVHGGEWPTIRRPEIAAAIGPVTAAAIITGLPAESFSL